jgi:hypothetical protein
MLSFLPPEITGQGYLAAQVQTVSKIGRESDYGHSVEESRFGWHVSQMDID